MIKLGILNNIMRLSVIKYFLLIPAVLLSGCATMDNNHRINSLDTTTANYRNAIRWGLYDVADNLRGAEGSEKNSRKLEKLKKIQVTGYKSVHKDISDDGKEAKQTVEIKYYHEDQMVEKTLIDMQVWKYNSEKKAWYLQSGLPEFK
ncbi:hypothetical protein BMS3Bbin09_00957 [bacterium BMS3Bbin09]|nr:hypothetical protein BMS3Bbin09_00957 [bacterium BMS3Bbin09]